MDNELFSDILEGIQEMIDIEKGIKKPSSKVVNIETSPAKIRKELNLTQRQFATFIGVSEHTLKNWEQGKRKVPAIANTLFKVVQSNPRMLLDIK